MIQLFWPTRQIQNNSVGYDGLRSWRTESVLPMWHDTTRLWHNVQNKETMCGMVRYDGSECVDIWACELSSPFQHFGLISHLNNLLKRGKLVNFGPDAISSITESTSDSVQLKSGPCPKC